MGCRELPWQHVCQSCFLRRDFDKYSIWTAYQVQSPYPTFFFNLKLHCSQKRGSCTPKVVRKCNRRNRLRCFRQTVIGSVGEDPRSIITYVHDVIYSAYSFNRGIRLRWFLAQTAFDGVSGAFRKLAHWPMEHDFLYKLVMPNEERFTYSFIMSGRLSLSWKGFEHTYCYSKNMEWSFPIPQKIIAVQIYHLDNTSWVLK